MRVRYCCVSSREVTCRVAIARCISRIEASTMLNFFGCAVTGKATETRTARRKETLSSVALGAAALVLPEVTFAKPDGLRGDLDQLVIAYELYRVFQSQGNRRGEVDRLVLARGADVGELLGLDRVHHQIVVARVDADDHALV